MIDKDDKPTCLRQAAKAHSRHRVFPKFLYGKEMLLIGL